MEENQRLALKEEFVNLLRSSERERIEDLIKFLEKSDFYTAPASTRYHGSYKDGLLEHSLNVYKTLLDVVKLPIFAEKCKDIKFSSLIITALLHDICKAYYYAEDTRNVKNKETGQWEQVPYYTVDDKVPYGHGEKSVMMISEFLKLSPEEKAAIRFHMGFSEPKELYNTLGVAFEKYPLAMALHFSDLISSHIIEVKE